jgi:hypothetical protein
MHNLLTSPVPLCSPFAPARVHADCVAVAVPRFAERDDAARG